MLGYPRLLIGPVSRSIRTSKERSSVASLRDAYGTP
ncbi:hypothetical protein NS506_02527 [Nocardia seriolae]|uniref:Uncharacterized protein n=1 Tax=Nocardia seriolae TaxID=37332 RepID=A0ABC8AR77_9NOCA|nr:hypothetical protein NS506_02527 [Nocardia seriolae]